MTAGRSGAAGWAILPSSCNATTFHAFRRCKPRSTTSFARTWRCWPVAKFELFGTARCPYTQDMRDWLDWQRRDFVEYDVEADAAARKRMHVLAGGQRSVPVLVEDGKVIQVGWQ